MRATAFESAWVRTARPLLLVAVEGKQRERVVARVRIDHHTDKVLWHLQPRRFGCHVWTVKIIQARHMQHNTMPVRLSELRTQLGVARMMRRVKIPAGATYICWWFVPFPGVRMYKMW
mmetsp:Transcript_47339/g.122448  ORF Transcript_47339/g.122448 Transcript_47339/m.122448 type:complete len:118 (-) Transcript_47339:3295-3648(-)